MNIGRHAELHADRARLARRQEQRERYRVESWAARQKNYGRPSLRLLIYSDARYVGHAVLALDFQCAIE
jgi:hypothetical protein